MKMSHCLVCVIDDDPSIRRSVLRLLQAEGYPAEGFDSAPAYLARAVSAVPTCVVLDKLMPGMSGLELQRKLVERDSDENIVFITGDDDIPTSVQAMKAGAVDFLAKPFKDDRLLEAVSRAVARSGERKRARAEREKARAQLSALTQREQQVLSGVITGKMNKEIATELGTSVRTIKVQRGNMMRKTGTTSVADLVRLARRADPEAR